MAAGETIFRLSGCGDGLVNTIPLFFRMCLHAFMICTALAVLYLVCCFLIFVIAVLHDEIVAIPKMIKGIREDIIEEKSN